METLEEAVVCPSTGLKEASFVTSVKEPAWDLPGSEDAQTSDPLEVQNKHTNTHKKKHQFKPAILWFTAATSCTSASILKTDPCYSQTVYLFISYNFKNNNNYFLEQYETVGLCNGDAECHV